MTNQKSLRGTIAQVLVSSVFASLCAAAHAEPGCPAGNCLPVVTTTAAPDASSAKTPAKATTWTAQREGSLRELLTQWAAAAGWQEPVWHLKPEEDFTLGASFEHTGELTEAVPALFDAFPAEFNLRVRMYAANRLIVVEQTNE
jgi:hypothetical protein